MPNTALNDRHVLKARGHVGDQTDQPADQHDGPTFKTDLGNPFGLPECVIALAGGAPSAYYMYHPARCVAQDDIRGSYDDEKLRFPPM